MPIRSILRGSPEIINTSLHVHKPGHTNGSNPSAGSRVVFSLMRKLVAIPKSAHAAMTIARAGLRQTPHSWATAVAGQECGPAD